MNSILFTWNPAKWEWSDLGQAVLETNQQGKYCMRWSCGVSKFIKPGDRAFLMRLGQHPKGLIGAGYVASEVFSGAHWASSEASKEKRGRYVEIEFNHLSGEPIISEDELADAQFSGQNWFPQASGTSIREPVASVLERLWVHRVTGLNIGDQAHGIALYSEGRRLTGRSYYYERDASAREMCLAIHGHQCVVCRFDFGEFYGSIGDGFIHVHHKRPLSMTAAEHVVDPRSDLVPLCPNCHAMVHTRNPPLEIDELRSSLRNRHGA